MKFAFSPDFRLSDYQQLLGMIGAEINTYREISGISVKELMADLHVGHAHIKKCWQVSLPIPFIISLWSNTLLIRHPLVIHSRSSSSTTCKVTSWQTESSLACDRAIRTMAVSLDYFASVLAATHIAHMDEGRVEDELVIVNVLIQDDQSEPHDQQFPSS